MYQWIAVGGVPTIFQTPFQCFGEFLDYNSWKKNSLNDEDYFSMIIVNCDEKNPEEIVQYTDDMSKHLESNLPIFLIYPSVEHKKALAKAGVLINYVAEESVALFICPQRDEDDNLHIALAEQFAPVRDGICEYTHAFIQKDGKAELQDKKVYRVVGKGGMNLMDIAPFINHVRDACHQIYSDGFVRFGNDGDVTIADPPSGIPKTLWNRTPINIFQSFVPKGAAADDYNFAPPDGSVTFEALVSLGVYYDNVNYSTPVQFVYLEHSGHMYTKMQRNDSDARGWSNARLIIDGENLSNNEFVSFKSSPNNVSGQKECTVSSELSVGLEAGTEGISGNANYTVGSSETIVINDWEVKQNDSNSWTFEQTSPYNGSIDDFPDGAAGYSGVSSVPSISESALAYNTQSLWVRNPASRTDKKTINYSYETRHRFTWSGQHNSTQWHAWSWRYDLFWNKNFCIDFTKAYPTK